MRSLPHLHESRVYGPENFLITSAKILFCNNICQKQSFQRLQPESHLRRKGLYRPSRLAPIRANEHNENLQPGVRQKLAARHSLVFGTIGNVVGRVLFVGLPFTYLNPCEREEQMVRID
jgi:hypothetical protein